MIPPSNPPEGKLIPIRAGLAAPSIQRDPRIDAFRGLALVMIIINHIPGNPWEVLTVRNFGFSDAAEAFFVMSGIAAGIAYSPKIARWLAGDLRLWDAFAPMWQRAWKLYSVQILLTVLTIGLFAWATHTFFRTEFRVVHNLGLIYSETETALMGLVTLGYQIGYVNILPTYILLLLAAPFILAAAIKAPWWTLMLSFGVWLVAGAYQINIPNHPGGGGWFFSPLTWQFIFVIGLVIGIRHREGGRLVPVSKLGFALAAGFLVLSFVWSHVPAVSGFLNHKMAQLGNLGAPSNITTHIKTYLALPRLLHILALVYVISCFPAVTRACAHHFAAPFRLMGAHGLLVFGVGTILALASQIAILVEPSHFWVRWVVPLIAIGICYGSAVIADAARRSGQGAKRADQRGAAVAIVSGGSSHTPTVSKA